MYLDHFGLQREPFALTPDVDFLFVSSRHEEALAHLHYAVNRGGGGFLALVGEVGTGKTMVCRALIRDLNEDVRVGLIYNTALSPTGLLAAICDEFGLSCRQRTRKSLFDTITTFLLDAHAKGQHCCLILDEAQNLSYESLEQLRLLTNIESASRKLLQIMLVGQPELHDRLSEHRLRQLRQRITVYCELLALDREETAAYVAHRLACAGAECDLFRSEAMRALSAAAAGLPRMINVLADRALLSAYARGSTSVTRSDARRSIQEIATRPGRQRPHWAWRKPTLALISLALGTVMLMALNYQYSGPSAEVLLPDPSPVDATAREPDRAKSAFRVNDGLTLAAALAAVAEFDLSQVEASPPNDAGSCLRWRDGNMRCGATNLSVASLAVIQPPLLLHSSEGWLQWLGLAEDGAAILKGRGRTILSSQQLAETWDGQAIGFFRAPELVPERYQIGDSGPAVAWMTALLGQATNDGRLLDTFNSSVLDRYNALRASFGLGPQASIDQGDMLLLQRLHQFKEQE